MITCGAQIVSGSPVNGAGVSLSDATPAAPGTAAAGTSTSASRGDHVHPLQTLASAGTLAARPAASATVLGRSYFATNVSPAGALYVCLTDGAGGYAWAPVYLGSDGDAAGTATVADGADGVKKTGSVVAGLLNATTAAGACTAIGAVPTSTLTTRGDLLRRGAAEAERLALGAAKRILSSDGTDAVYQTIAALLTDIGDTRGHILRRGASAWEALAAQTSDTFVGGDGTDVGVRTMAQVRTSLALPATAISSYGNGAGADATWAGWTYSESGSTARTDGVVTGGRLRITVTSGAAISPGNTTNWSVTIPAALRSRAWRFRVRIATLTGSSAGTRFIFFTGPCYVSMYPNGTMYAGPSPEAASGAAAMPFDGTGWVEYRFDGGQVTLRYGTGTSTTPPTSWTNGRVYPMPNHTAEPTSFGFAVEQYDALAGTLTMEIDHATIGPVEDGGWL